ncbi:MAG TPA: hypothetical protein VN688_14315 [Gemmataceae bacterium]|nr:hypothetical protein [Gemmataceae bacterium]
MQNARRFTLLTPEQCHILRRAAHRCLVSCLRTLEPGTFAQGGRARYPDDPGERGKEIKTSPHCGHTRFSWQAAMLQKWLERLECHKRGLSHALGTSDQQAREGAEKDGFDLAALLGLIFIPAAGFTGFWDLAADEATDFLRLLASASESRRPPRRGMWGPPYLKLLAAPVLWALVFTRLELHEAACPETRADRLQRTGSIANLFDVLGRLADLPPSVCFAAAALAAVASPPAAVRWIDKARQQAHSHGASGFATFFSQLVTRG